MSWRANFRMVSGERTPWHPGGIAEVNDILPRQQLHQLHTAVSPPRPESNTPIGR